MKYYVLFGKRLRMSRFSPLPDGYLLLQVNNSRMLISTHFYLTGLEDTLEYAIGSQEAPRAFTSPLILVRHLICDTELYMTTFRS